MEVAAKSGVRFANFELDLSTGELRSNGDRTYLQEKPFQILSLLLERPGQLVTRDQLMKHLWPDGTFVDFDQSLNKAMNRLREALGDSAEKPRFIETLPRRGYRFIGQIENHALAPNPESSAAIPLQPAKARPWWPMWAALLALALVAITVGRQWFAVRRSDSNPLENLKQRRLTANSSENAVESDVISPDGKMLAYSDRNGIHIQRLETGQVRDVALPESLKGKPQSWLLANTWIRDGSSIIANAVPSGQPPSIWLVPVTGAPMRKIRDNALAWAVSRDGMWVAFGANLDNLYYRELWIVHPDGTDAHKVFDADKDAAFGGAEFSPDGRRLAYVKLRRLPDRGEETFESRPLEGGPAITAIASVFPRDIEDWSWSPDGRIIYSLIDDAERTCNFWQVRIDSQTGRPVEKARQLTNWSGFQMDNPSFSADGKRLTFLKSSIQGTLYLAEIRAGGAQISTPVRLTLNEGEDTAVGWADDNKTVLFLSNDNGHPQLFRQMIGQETAQPIGSALEEFATEAQISPDGDWMLYLVPPINWGSAQPVSLMRMALAGGAPQLVLESFWGATPSFRCARHPAVLCILAEQTPDHSQLVFTEVDPVRGRGREVARSGIEATPDAHYDWDLSPDGRRVAFLKESEAKITLLSLVGDSTEQIAVTKGPKLYSVRWAADGQGMFVSALGDGGATLLHLDLEGNTHSLWHTKGGIQQPGDVFRTQRLVPRAIPSPDGRGLAIQRSSVSSNVWMLENF
jgi:DNA-binding winged helix-turn-helix (wHTH) protein/Tol biopolymer transport system component